MERLYKQGLIRAIGVCNFHQHHIRGIDEGCRYNSYGESGEDSSSIITKRADRVLFRAKHTNGSIFPFGTDECELVQNPTLEELAQKYEKTVSQIILRWDYQCGIISIPKSQNYSRLKENISILDFELCQEDIEQVNAVNENYRVQYDPDHCDFSSL